MGNLPADDPLQQTRQAGILKLLTDLRQFLPDEQVVSEASEVSRLGAVTQHRSFPPQVYVYPASTDELSVIIRFANQHSVPVYVSSRGRNWGYGAATGTPGTSVCIVLERMNRIISVDDTLAFAVIEPGVSYRQLNEYLSKHHSGLWTDCTDSTPGGSVIGNALERGVGFTPYGDHFGCLCGLEVMLADGRIIRTGAVFDDQSPTFHLHKWGTGPVLDGIFSQSNFGIVLKAGIWLMPRPEQHISILGDIERTEDVFPTLDAIRRLQLEGTIQSKVHIANDIVNLALFAREDVAAVKGRLQSDQITSIRKKHGIPPWSFAFSIYGTNAQVKASRKRIKQQLRHTTSLHLFRDRDLTKIKRMIRWSRRFPAVARLVRRVLGKTPEVLSAVEPLHAVSKGIPTEYFLKHGYFRNSANSNCPENNVDPARDGCGLTWFAPVIPNTGEHLRKLIDITRPLFERHEMDFYLAILSLNPRCCVTLLSIYYQKEDPVSRQQADDLYQELQVVTQDAGYQQYRTGTLGADELYRRCPEYGELLSRIKSALDPGEILSPGRYGIGGR